MLSQGGMRLGNDGPKTRKGKELARSHELKNPCIEREDNMRYVVFHYENGDLEINAVNVVDPTDGYVVHTNQGVLKMKTLLAAMGANGAIRVQHAENDAVKTHHLVVKCIDGDDIKLPAQRAEPLDALAAFVMFDSRVVEDGRQEKKAKQLKMMMKGLTGDRRARDQSSSDEDIEGASKRSRAH